MTARAGIVVTGTEVLTGRVSDRNGPWLAESLRQLGVDVGQIVVVGDRPGDLRSALTHLAAGHDLVITSGGLGPTADDLTAAIVADFQGRPVELDAELELRIAAIVGRLVARFGGWLDPDATAAGTRKQAMVPVGATVLEPTGTAPGLVVTPAGRAGPPVIVLPGPPRELQAMWPAAIEQADVAAILAGAPELRQRTLRLWGVPESELAAMLRRSGSALDGLEITTCLRDGELEIVSRYRPDAEPAQQKLLADVRNSFSGKLFSEGLTADELVAAALTDRGWTLAVAEAGLGGRPTERLAVSLDGADGTSRFVGGLVVPSPTGSMPAGFAASDRLGHPDRPGSDTADRPGSDDADQPGSDDAERPGSDQRDRQGSDDRDLPPAAGMATAARAAFGADVGLGITGPRGSARSSGSGGAGGENGGDTVVIVVDSPAGIETESFELRGPAGFIRERASTLAVHLLRRLLSGDGPG